MRQFLVIIVVSVAMMGSLTNNAFAAPVDIYSFATPIQQAQFQQLTTELRCLVCQNESLADSNAGLANDLRKEVYAMVIQGKSDSEIKQYLVNRYGDFILFKPPVNKATAILWFAPFVLLIFIFVGISVFILRKKTKINNVELSEADKQRLKTLLKE